MEQKLKFLEIKNQLINIGDEPCFLLGFVTYAYSCRIWPLWVNAKASIRICCK